MSEADGTAGEEESEGETSKDSQPVLPLPQPGHSPECSQPLRQTVPTYYPLLWPHSTLIET